MDAKLAGARLCSKSGRVEAQLARYALATGALLAIPMLSHADVVYSGPQNIQCANTISGGCSSYTLDLDGVDFTFSNNKATPGSNPAIASITVSPGSNGSVAVDTNGYPTAFGGGSSIGAGSTYSSSSAQTLLEKTLYNGNASYTGNFPESQGASFDTSPYHFAYLGVQLDIAGQPHYGWIEVGVDAETLPPESFDIAGWAYETDPNVPITTPTPEPSSLALLALGAAGVTALRRKRARV